MKPGRADLDVLPDDIEQVERVLGPQVIRVSGKGRFQITPALGDGPGAKAVQASEGVSPPGQRVQLHRFSRKIDRLLVEASPGRSSGQGAEKGRVTRIDSEGAVTSLDETGGVVGHP